MGMNDFLAECYDTEANLGLDPSNEELEKQAAAEMLVEFTKQAGLNIDALNEDEIEYCYDEMVKAAGQGWNPYEQAEAEEDITKTAEFQMSDFMGRVMAHSMVDEQAKMAGIKETATAGYNAAKRGLQAASDWTGVSKIRSGLKERGRAMSAVDKAKENLAERAKEKAKSGFSSKAMEKGQENLIRRNMGAAKGASDEAWEGGKQLGLRVGVPAAALIAAGGGGYAMNKKGFNEEFEEVSQQRAYEMLAEAGYEVEKQAEADIGGLVDQRALEMLEEAGYPVNWE